MADALKIRGVPYRNFDEVERAVVGLAQEMTLAPAESGERDDYARHILDLLDHLPEDRAKELTEYISAPFKAAAETPDAKPLGAEGDTEGQTGDVRTPDESPVCPLCNGIGTLAVDPPQDPTSQRCDVCDGYGQVYTGSRIPAEAIRACPVCQGRGYRGVSAPAINGAPVIVAEPVPEWPGALWNQQTLRWDAPEGEKPWPDASWNDIRGAYV